MVTKKKILSFALVAVIAAGAFLCSCGGPQEIAQTEVEAVGEIETIGETEIVEETETETEPVQIRYIAASAVNFRQTPSTNMEPLQVLEFQTEVEYLTEANGWTMVHYGDRDGFISSELLVEEYPDTPIPEPVPAIVVVPSSPTLVQTTEPTIIEAGAGTYLGNFWITHYCSCQACCGPGGGHHTASGTVPCVGRTCAADPSLPFGTQVSVNGHVYVVEDRGGAVHGNHLDIYVATHQEAMQTYYADVYLVG